MDMGFPLKSSQEPIQSRLTNRQTKAKNNSVPVLI